MNAFLTALERCAVSAASTLFAGYADTKSIGSMKKGKKTKYIFTGVAAFFLFAALCPMPALAQQPMPGSYDTVPVTNQEVVAAAVFAVKAQGEAMQQAKDGKPSKLELVTILGAEQQVVAGMNYQLKLQVKQDGKEKMADAIVWWQAWRKPAPYQLTSWNWK